MILYSIWNTFTIDHFHAVLRVTVINGVMLVAFFCQYLSASTMPLQKTNVTDYLHAKSKSMRLIYKQQCKIVTFC